MPNAKFVATSTLAGKAVKALTGGQRVAVGAVIEVDPAHETAKRFIAEGHLVPHVEATAAPADKPKTVTATDPYAGKSLEDLQALAAERQLKVTDKMKLKEVLAVLREDDAKPK